MRNDLPSSEAKVESKNVDHDILNQAAENSVCTYIMDPTYCQCFSFLSNETQGSSKGFFVD